MRPRQLACVLCGADSGEVTVRLVEWREPIGERRWADIPRCRNVDACWSRVTTVLREDWEVNDGRPVRPLVAEAEPGAGGVESSAGRGGQGPRRSHLSGPTGSNIPAEPMEPVIAPVADAPEEPAWL